MQESDLNDLFAQARKESPVPSERLLANVLDSALAHQHVPVPVKRQTTVRGGFWTTMVAALGGSGGLAGLSTATLAGLWLGFVQPEPVFTLTDVLWANTTIDSVELIPSYDDILIEG